MNLETLQKNVPSLFATEAFEKASENYNFVRTWDYVEKFLDRGWAIHEAKQTKARVGNPEHAKHMVTLHHPEFGFNDRGVRPQVVFINSHNWSSRAKALMGLFRFICSNGLIVRDGYAEELNIRHDQPIAEAFSNIIETFHANSNRLSQVSQSWSRIIPSNDEVLDFAVKARDLRFGADSTSDPMSLVRYTRRVEDNGSDLWTVFNRLQENVTRKGPKFGGKRSTREITNIDKITELNQGLWALATDIATAHGCQN